MTAPGLRSAPAPAPGPSSRRQATSTAITDAAAVVFFAAVGRSSHSEGVTVAGTAATAWPFLAGAAVGWVLVRAWGRPLALRTGAAVWVAAVALGMGLRAATGQGTAPSFVVVATVALLVLLVGRRAAVAAVRRRPARA